MKRILVLTSLLLTANLFAADTSGFRPLFNGKNLDGWKMRNPEGNKSWSVQEGVLVNDVSEGKHGTDLVTEEKFRDFILRYEYKIPKGANSGVYLRGRYEIQILDDYDKQTARDNGNGSIYKLAAPAKFVSKPAGEWQTVETTIRGKEITVILNGEKIHNKVVVDKPTGGELDKNVTQPGPVMLQGDHGSISFRKIEIKELTR
jgi:hypothetical protein